MDDQGNLTTEQNAALVILAFLQADCSPECRKELHSLGQEISLNITRDINCNDPSEEALDEGNLECDGNICVTVHGLADIQPSVELQMPVNRAEAAAIQQVAEELREIAAQLEHNVVARATQNLRRNLSADPSEPTQVRFHLTQEVERVMRQGVGLDHLPQERVIMALTLTLVKGVCERTPQLLRNLFHTALDYIIPARAR